MKNHILPILVTFLINLTISFSQSYQFKGNNLYGLEYFKADSTQVAMKVIFYDVDLDGDQDAITVGIDVIDNTGEITFDKITYFISMQENIGDKWNPSFAPRKPFIEDFPFPNGYFFPAIADLNGDNKVDLFVTAGTDAQLNIIPLYYERKSLSGTDQFTIIPSPSLDLEYFIAGSFFMPELVDMDKDGDLDILLSGFLAEIDPNTSAEQQPIFMYAKNEGTITQPSFVGWYQNPYGLASLIGETQIAIVGDVDNDNDNDILSLTAADTFTLIKLYRNNVQPNGKPSFQAATVPSFGLPFAGSTEQILPPSLVDIDADGDLDLFMVQQLVSYGTGIGYYENEICGQNIEYLNQSICTGESVTIGNNVYTSSGDYVTTIVLPNNCEKTVHLSLTVSDNTASSQTMTACSGETITIGNQPFNQSGNYAVTIKNSNGCDSTISASLTFIVVDNTVTQTQTSLTANANNVSYQWFNCNTGLDIPGAIFQTISPSVTGVYGVRVTDANGCINTSSCYTFISTNTEDLEFASKIILFPNPTTDGVTILNKTGKQITQVSFINSAGKVVQTINDVHGGDMESTSSFAPGNYIVELVSGDIKVYKKLVVVKK